jgi:hypothetical protein
LEKNSVIYNYCTTKAAPDGMNASIQTRGNNNNPTNSMRRHPSTYSCATWTTQHQPSTMTYLEVCQLFIQASLFTYDLFYYLYMNRL